MARPSGHLSEMMSLGQVAEDPVAELEELPVVLNALADRHHPRVPYRFFQPLEVIESGGRSSVRSGGMALSLRCMGPSGGGCSQRVLFAFAEFRAVLAMTDQARPASLS
jgi:hypothetical protein